MNTKSSILALAVVAAAAMAAPTFADAPSAPQATVRYSDLDLSASSGVQTLYHRIKNAAFRVCLTLTPAHNGPSGIENLKCQRTLVDAAVVDVDKPALTALHAGKKADDRVAGR